MELSRRGERPISEQRARQFAREIGAVSYIECSALTQFNLKLLFDTAILSAISHAHRLGAENLKGSKVSLAELKGRKSFRSTLREIVKRPPPLKRSESSLSAKQNLVRQPFSGQLQRRSFSATTGLRVKPKYPRENAGASFSDVETAVGRRERESWLIRKRVKKEEAPRSANGTLKSVRLNVGGELRMKEELREEKDRMKRGWKCLLCIA